MNFISVYLLINYIKYYFIIILWSLIIMSNFKININIKIMINLIQLY